MTDKTLPFSRDQLEAIARTYPTPFHIYDEKAIRENARSLLNLFAWNPGFKEFFAVKAAPNPFLLKLLHAEGFGADCSSLPELILAERAGIVGGEIMFSSNDTPAEEFVKSRSLGATINLDDISHIDFLQQCCGIPETISVRYNPGKLREGSFIMGKPEEAKYGFTRAQVFEGLHATSSQGRETLRTARLSGLQRAESAILRRNRGDAVPFGRRGVAEAWQIRVQFVNISGGVGIPYKPDETAVDLSAVSAGIRAGYDKLVRPAGLHPLALYMECGRAITGPYGYLVSRVLHIKNIYKKYVGLDACMANLMRPAMYGAYHHITVAGKEGEPRDQLYDVTGSLCENRDKFAVDRRLPRIDIGDLVVIHDAGAHGHSMGFNYNGKLRSAELLLRENGEVLQIRRPETIDDYFATLDWDALERF